MAKPITADVARDIASAAGRAWAAMDEVARLLTDTHYDHPDDMRGDARRAADAALRIAERATYWAQTLEGEERPS